MNTCFGIVFDAIGQASTQELVQGELRTRAWSSPAHLAMREQPSVIYVDREHDHRPIGQVIDLELRGGNLWAVAELDDGVGPYTAVRVGDEVRMVEDDLFFSATRYDTDDGLVIGWLSLTTSPARLTARAAPVEFREGRAHIAARKTVDRHERGMLERAAEANRTRWHGEPLRIRDAPTSARGLSERNHPALLAARAENSDWGQGRPTGPLRKSVPYHGVIAVH